MFSTGQIRSLGTALTGLMILVSLSVVLLLTTAFLYPAAEPASPPAETGKTQSATVAKAKPLTEQQLAGKSLFENNCAQCHSATTETVVGPGLKGITSRTPGEAWLLKWIRNSQAVVASGDPYAVQVYNKFGKVAMSGFPNLTDADIKAILAYVDADESAPTTAR